MPTILSSYSDICRLLGRRLSWGRLKESLHMLGVEVEGPIGDELKLEVPHNRIDLLSTEGVARALKGFLGIEVGPPEYRVRGSGVIVKVDPSTEEIRPFIVSAIVEDVKFTDKIIAALMQIQEKLHDTVGRRRRRASIGVYDLDKVKPPIIYTSVAPDGIKFIPLDFDRELTPSQILREHPKGVEYAGIISSLPRYPLLIDSEGTVLSMPPIINSEDTKVEESTKRLFIDVTGDDERAVNQALVAITTSLAERGFMLLSVEVRYRNRKVRTPDLKATRWRMSIKNANDLLGLKLKPREVISIMRRMRYGVAGVKGDIVTLISPAYRSDLMHEVDLIEDLAIGYGYNKLLPTLPPVLTVGGKHPVEIVSERARRILTGMSFMEAMNYTLTNPNVNFGMMRTSGEAVTIGNPISEDYTILRTWLIPGLLQALKLNKRYPLPQRFFEVGDVVLLDEKAETGGREVRRAAGAVIGPEANFSYIKSVAEALLNGLGVKYEIMEVSHPSFIEGRAAGFYSEGAMFGIFGEIHPEVILAFGLEDPVAAFEIDLQT